MDFLKTLEVCTIILGLVSIGLSCRWCMYFMTSRHGIGRSVALMTLAEAVCSTVMVVFAIMAITNTRDYVNPLLLTFMRIFMFAIVTLSTIHLAHQVRRITDELDNEAESSDTEV